MRGLFPNCPPSISVSGFFVATHANRYTPSVLVYDEIDPDGARSGIRPFVVFFAKPEPGNDDCLSGDAQDFHPRQSIPLMLRKLNETAHKALPEFPRCIYARVGLHELDLEHFAELATLGVQLPQPPPEMVLDEDLGWYKEPDQDGPGWHPDCDDLMPDNGFFGCIVPALFYNKKTEERKRFAAAMQELYATTCADDDGTMFDPSRLRYRPMRRMFDLVVKEMLYGDGEYRLYREIDKNNHGGAATS